MRLIDQHPCTRRHRSTKTFAACIWPGATITGTGYLALVNLCHEPVITLFERLAPAQLLRNEIGVFKCSRGCTRQHELVALDIDGPQTP